MKKLFLLFLLFASITYAQYNNVSTYTVTIDSGATVSSALNIRNYNSKIIGVSVDTTNWTSANLTIQSYNPSTTKWESVVDEDGNAFTITLGAITVPTRVVLSPMIMAGLDWVKFVSSAAQDTDDITIYVHTRPY